MGEELNQTATIIKKTGIFSNIDKLYGTMKPDEGGAEEGAAGGEIEAPADTGLETGVEETPPLDLGGDEGGGGEADLELASVDESDLPLILEKFDNNNKFDLEQGESNLKEVSDQLESLLKD